MSNYETYENAIVTLLASDVYKVRSMPDNESELLKDFVKPVVFVEYSGSSFGEPENNMVWIQNDVISFEILVRSKTRKGASGILTLVETIREKLLGYTFAGCTKIQMVKNSYIAFTNNSWSYSIGISFVGRVIENLPEETAIGKFGTNVSVTQTDITFTPNEVQE